MDVRVQQAIERMEQRLHTKLTVAEIAREVGLSVAQLTRLFRASVRKTPGAFLRELRLARARLLVERTNLSIAEVMTQVGIADRSHFARDFRLTHGSSPRTLRMHLRAAPPRRASG